MNNQNSTITSFIIRHSGGLIKTEKQLIVISAIILLITLWILFSFTSPASSGGSDVPPPYDASTDIPPEGETDYD